MYTSVQYQLLGTLVFLMDEILILNGLRKQRIQLDDQQKLNCENPFL